MTTQYTEAFTPPAPEPSPLVVHADTHDKLEQLHALYADLKAKADAAAKELKVVTDAIKVELTALDPDSRRFTLTGSHGPALALTYSVSHRFDSKRFRRDQPAAYEAYLAESGSWTLKAAPHGGAA